MQQLEDRGEPAWVGNCNELNAAYATDSYARINGIGAMIVTHGVGTLSAVNGIAGAYSEHVPVILISGSLPLRAIQRGDLMHHTVVDREKGNLSRIFAEITETQARLTPESAVTEVDRLILTAWRRKRPVYLELPSDIPYLEIETPDSPLKLEIAPSEREKARLSLRTTPSHGCYGGSRFTRESQTGCGRGSCAESSTWQLFKR
jgi:indolepyruvate decarboxylase